MRYHGRVPAAPLDSYIDDIYVLVGTPRHRRLNVPPMPSSHLFINLGDPIVVHDPSGAGPDGRCTDGWFMGLWTRRLVLEYPAQVRMAGVHFKPWGMSAFLDTPLSELRDGFVDASSLWGVGFDRLRERTGAATSTEEVLDAIEDELHHRVISSPSLNFELVERSAGSLARSWGGGSVGALAQRAGVSSTHVATQYKLHVGLTPKRLARIYRFARLILSMDPAHPVDWPALAHATGYSDQAHLGREFKDFTGHTPTEYLALRRRFPADHEFPPDQGPMPAV